MRDSNFHDLSEPIVITLEIPPSYVNIAFELKDENKIERPDNEYLAIWEDEKTQKTFAIIPVPHVSSTTHDITIMSPDKRKLSCTGLAFVLLFSMTFDKVQGQTMGKLIANLGYCSIRSLLLTQLYVFVTRTKEATDLRILDTDLWHLKSFEQDIYLFIWKNSYDDQGYLDQNKFKELYEDAKAKYPSLFFPKKAGSKGKVLTSKLSTASKASKPPSSSQKATQVNKIKKLQSRTYLTYVFLNYLNCIVTIFFI